MGLTFSHLTAGVYLLAGMAAAAGVVLGAAWLRRTAVTLLAAGVVLHTLVFFLMHVGTPPPLTDLASAISLAGWIGGLFFLVLLLFRPRLAGLVMLVGPMAFLCVFFDALPLAKSAAGAAEKGAMWSHSHVLLGTGGLALLGVAGLSGILLLVEDRRLKVKRPLGGGARLPSLESLDRASAVSLAVGFPVLTLGVITGALWQHSMSGVFWSGSPHEIACLVAWAVYVVLVGARFGAHQGTRASAMSAVAGFAILLFAVIGVGLFA